MKIDDLLPQMMQWRKDLHQIPEIGWQERKTAAYIRETLDKLGVPWEKIVGTGTLVYFDCAKETTLAFRSDIDALPIQEKSSFPYPSNHLGFMHACGHDGHMTSLLALASWAKDHLPELKHNLLLIFQPAEETTGGAKDIVNSGILEKYQVSSVYGLHLTPDLPEGTIGIKSGPFMAQTGEITVEIQGKSSHAALASEGIDALYIATQLMQQYQGILTRQIPATANAVLHFGELHAGEAPNVVAKKALLKGTLRTFDSRLFLQIIRHMEMIHQGAEHSYGCKVTLTAHSGYPPVINDPVQTEKLHQLLMRENIFCHLFEEPYFLAEDFSYYQERVPGVFFFLGIRNEEKGFVHGLHNEQFNFDEAVLLTGLKAFIGILTHPLFSKS